MPVHTTNGSASQDQRDGVSRVHPGPVLGARRYGCDTARAGDVPAEEAFMTQQS